MDRIPALNAGTQIRDGGLSSFWLKIIACAAMLTDHSALVAPAALGGWYTAMRCVGRIAFPLFAYQLASGYAHTSDVRRYMLRMAAFALISQAPFYLFLSPVSYGVGLNIFFTLLLGLMCAYVNDNCPWKWAAVTFCGLAVAAGGVCNVDYGSWGVTLVFMFCACGSDRRMALAMFAALAAVKFAPQMLAAPSMALSYYLPMMLCTLASSALMLAHSGRRGRRMGLAVYIFYPAHLTLLYAVRVLFVR